MLKKWWHKGKHVNTERDRGSNKGQSLVELAIAFPVLLMLFVGLMEVSLILHSYLILVNADREAARYAGRAPEFYNELLEDVTNDVIALRAIQSAAPLHPNLAQIGGDFTVYIHRFHINTGQAGDPLDNDIRINNVPSEDDCPPPCMHTCTDWINNYGIVYTPYITGTQITVQGEPRVSSIDPLAKCQQLYNDNENFNEAMATREHATEVAEGTADGVYQSSSVEVVVVELFYDHAQALGVPIITAFIPDPIELRIDSEMRITGVGREQVH